MKYGKITVVKGTRGYGYSLHYELYQSWLKGGHVGGWYKYKKDAIERANELMKGDL